MIYPFAIPIAQKDYDYFPFIIVFSLRHLYFTIRCCNAWERYKFSETKTDRDTIAEYSVTFIIKCR